MNRTEYPGPDEGTALVALSANAGISLTFGGKRIWVDALHRPPKAGPDGYSHVTPALWEEMKRHDAFMDPDVICFTHFHEDHYDEALARLALEEFPSAGLILPERREAFSGQRSCLVLSGSQVTLQSDGVVLRFVRLPHEGEKYRDVIMYGLVIQAQGRSILIGSDCATASPRLAGFLAGEWQDAGTGAGIGLAILPFPWLTLRKGRAFLEQHIHPEHLLLYHIPFVEDDLNGYREAAASATAAYGAGQGSTRMDVRMLAEPLQTETVRLSSGE